MTQKFCNCIELVENYQEAKKDNFKKWQIHHRLETHNSEGKLRLIQLSREELKALDMYYNRPAEELIYLRLAEHTRLHFTGTPASKEKKMKISQALMGHTFSQETKDKISATLKGNVIKEETKEKISKSTKIRMAEVERVYYEKYKGQMSWNEYQRKIKVLTI